MQITLTIDSPETLTKADRDFLTALAGIGLALKPEIAYEDRPDVGVIKEESVFAASAALGVPLPILPPLAAPVVLPPALVAVPTPLATLSAPVTGDGTGAALPDALDPAVVFAAPAAPVAPAVPVAVVIPPAPPIAASVPLPPPQPLATEPPAGGAALQWAFGMAPPPVVTPPTVDTAPIVAPPAFDIQGLPWDARIHAGTKGRNGDGKWKKRKNVEPETIAAVEAELRTLLAIPTPAAPGSPPPPVADGTPATFPALMAWVAKQVADGRLSQGAVFKAVAPLGLTSVIGLGNRPDLVPAVYAALSEKAGL